jgi:SAM-dependent methyltransferase
MLKSFAAHLDGYGAMLTGHVEASHDTTTEEYAQDQRDSNVRITREYLEPVLDRTRSRTVLDVGCGVGTTVRTLVEDGYDAYGVDVAPLTRFWARDDAPRDRFFVVAPDPMELPFEDGVLDMAFTFGVVEHVGTSDGHATRREDYHACRREWLREVFRTVRPGGHVLIGGPNRAFPLDFSHGLDARSSAIERGLSRLVGASVHRTWGEYFLWGYPDIARYLGGLDFHVEALSTHGLLKFGRVPGLVRPLAALYVEKLPRFLLSTALNPWMLALVRKGPAAR